MHIHNSVDFNNSELHGAFHVYIIIKVKRTEPKILAHRTREHTYIPNSHFILYILSYL